MNTMPTDDKTHLHDVRYCQIQFRETDFGTHWLIHRDILIIFVTLFLPLYILEGRRELEIIKFNKKEEVNWKMQAGGRFVCRGLQGIGKISHGDLRKLTTVKNLSEKSRIAKYRESYGSVSDSCILFKVDASKLVPFQVDEGNFSNQESITIQIK